MGFDTFPEQGRGTATRARKIGLNKVIEKRHIGGYVERYVGERYCWYVCTFYFIFFNVTVLMFNFFLAFKKITRSNKWSHSIRPEVSSIRFSLS